jgi:peptidoglycan/LPS O-acetylase OafA/YrhL
VPSSRGAFFQSTCDRVRAPLASWLTRGYGARYQPAAAVALRQSAQSTLAGTVQTSYSTSAQSGVEPRAVLKTQPSQQKEFYIPCLDGLRAMAFLLVFFAHAGLDNIVPGGFGITMFFFLSGYLITTILRVEAAKTEDISLANFYLRRAFRILPPMYVTLALAFALGAAGVLHDKGNLFGLTAATFYFFNYADLLHLHAILPTGTNVLWSLMVEEHFYLIFPVAYLAFIRKRISAARQTSILLGFCMAALVWRVCLVYIFHTPLETLPRWTYSASDARFDAILFGCILAIRDNPWFDDSSVLLRRMKGPLASGGLFIIFLTLIIREPHFRETLRYTLQSVALYPVFYYCVSSSNQWQTRWLEWKPLRYLGWVSFAMYLIHLLPLEAGFERYPSHPVLVTVASFGLALLYAWLIRTYVERPSRRWRGHFEGLIKAARNRTRSA